MFGAWEGSLRLELHPCSLLATLWLLLALVALAVGLEPLPPFALLQLVADCLPQHRLLTPLVRYLVIDFVWG